MNIEKDGIVYFIKREKGELSNYYFDKCKLILSENPRSSNKLEQLVNKYTIVLNEKYLKCSY
tara:strand:- start:718 stop:903 length:186 start_codon:yes stop_codon:yes gene_type:complete